MRVIAVIILMSLFALFVTGVYMVLFAVVIAPVGITIAAVRDIYGCIKERIKRS